MKLVECENQLNSTKQELDRMFRQKDEMNNELELYQNKLKGLE